MCRETPFRAANEIARPPGHRMAGPDGTAGPADTDGGAGQAVEIPLPSEIGRRAEVLRIWPDAREAARQDG